MAGKLVDNSVLQWCSDVTIQKTFPTIKDNNLLSEHHEVDTKSTSNVVEQNKVGCYYSSKYRSSDYSLANPCSHIVGGVAEIVDFNSVEVVGVNKSKQLELNNFTTAIDLREHEFDIFTNTWNVDKKSDLHLVYQYPITSVNYPSNNCDNAHGDKCNAYEYSTEISDEIKKINLTWSSNSKTVTKESCGLRLSDTRNVNCAAAGNALNTQLSETSDNPEAVDKYLVARSHLKTNYAARSNLHIQNTETACSKFLDQSNNQIRSKMSSGPPHHPHSRQTPSANTAWNHLQVPNYFASRQPQHAHMSNDHPLLHQPTWHTPTTEPVKNITHSHLFNLEQMIGERPYPRHSPGVDLSLQRNGSQNGELPASPISLSVRDANKINSLPPSAIDIQAIELTKSLSPGLKAISPGVKSTSPSQKPVSPGISTSPAHFEKQGSPKSSKRPNKRVDSLLERLNPLQEREKPDRLSETEKCDETLCHTSQSFSKGIVATVTECPMERDDDKLFQEKSNQQRNFTTTQSVIVQPSVSSSSQNENNNAGCILNTPTYSNVKQDDSITFSYSNEENMDSYKSKRKRKPLKTVKVAKDDEKLDITIDTSEYSLLETEDKKGIEAVENQSDKYEISERRRSGSAPPSSPTLLKKIRRKTSSESETVANIAAMVQQGINQPRVESEQTNATVEEQPISVSVKINNSQESVIQTVSKDSEPIQAPVVINHPVNMEKLTPVLNDKVVNDTKHFVEVENKLEEMFAGISDDTGESARAETLALDFNDDSKTLGLDETKLDESISKLESDKSDIVHVSDNVTSTSGEVSNNKMLHKRGRPKGSKSNSRRSSVQGSSFETIPKKKKVGKSAKTPEKLYKNKTGCKTSTKGRKLFNSKPVHSKVDTIKDVYAYDSGSNASSNKSKGPYIQIRGPRDSPLSVSVVNTPTNEDDVDRKPHKSKKFHDDSEYRHKVQSRGLHCSTLSNKYDAQTRDTSWICVFCKRGPHANDPYAADHCRLNLYTQFIAPGDLFGPYIITTESAEYHRRLDDPYDQQFKSKKISKALNAYTNLKVTSKKSKRKNFDNADGRTSFDKTDNLEVYLGIMETKEKTYEVWAHEDCLVWSSGVYLVGPKIIGLEEAVWTSCNVNCSYCHRKGANVCCLKRGCTSVTHIFCARMSNWQIDEENYKAYCVVHKTP